METKKFQSPLNKQFTNRFKGKQDFMTKDGHFGVVSNTKNPIQKVKVSDLTNVNFKQNTRNSQLRSNIYTDNAYGVQTTFGTGGGNLIPLSPNKYPAFVQESSSPEYQSSPSKMRSTRAADYVTGSFPNASPTRSLKSLKQKMGPERKQFETPLKDIKSLRKGHHRSIQQLEQVNVNQFDPIEQEPITPIRNALNGISQTSSSKHSRTEMRRNDMRRQNSMQKLNIKKYKDVFGQENTIQGPPIQIKRKPTDIAKSYTDTQSKTSAHKVKLIQLKPITPTALSSLKSSRDVVSRLETEPGPLTKQTTSQFSLRKPEEKKQQRFDRQPPQQDQVLPPLVPAKSATILPQSQKIPEVYARNRPIDNPPSFGKETLYIQQNNQTSFYARFMKNQNPNSSSPNTRTNYHQRQETKSNKDFSTEPYLGQHNKSSRNLNTLDKQPDPVIRHSLQNLPDLKGVPKQSMGQLRTLDPTPNQNKYFNSSRNVQNKNINPNLIYNDNHYQHVLGFDPYWLIEKPL